MLRNLLHRLFPRYIWGEAEVRLEDFWDMQGLPARREYFGKRGIPVGDNRYIFTMEFQKEFGRYVYRWRMK